MIELVLGPARSGKGERGLERFCGAVGEGREGRAMWLVPNRNLARTLRRRAAERLGALAEPKILTLDDLARWVFESAPEGRHLLSELSRLLLLSKIAEETYGSSFVGVLARAVDDLKEHFLWPGGAPKEWARAYDAALEKEKAFDRKSMVAEAVRRLEESDHFFVSARVDQLLFYGFTSFSPLEWRLVEAMIRRRPAWVALTADLERPELFAESLATARRLESQFPISRREELRGKSLLPSARRLEFSTYDAELEWVAREAARLCREEGVAPDEIAVVSGAGAGSAWWARQIFRRYGLAVESFCAEPLEAQPAVRRVERLREEGELKRLLELPDEEAVIHFAALEQWNAARREMEGHPLFRRFGETGLRHLRFSPPRLAVPAIHFYSAEAPPLESYRVVFVAHLLENSFPRRPAVNLFSGAAFFDEETHRSQERLVFYQMLTRAGEKLYLTHSRKDFHGEEALPSLYLREWELFFPGAEVPPAAPAEILAPRLDAARHSDVEPAMRLFLERKNRARLESPAILAEIRKKLEGEGSVTQLEKFSTCHYLHLAQSLMRLQEVEEGVPARVKGTIAHEVLAALGPHLLEEKESSLLEKMEAETDAQFERTPFRAPKFLVKLEKQILKRQLAAFLRAERERLRETGYRPRFFEQPFGREGIEPYRLPVADGFTLTLRGRIDRIDVAPDGKTAEVIDYKSGELPAKQEMKEGTSLQIQCYLDACEKIFGLAPVEGYYLSLKGKRVGIPKKELAERVAAARAALGAAAQEMLTGSIVAKANPRTCERCAGRSICRTDEEG